MSVVLSVSDIVKSYRGQFLFQKTQVLHGVSFEVEKGSITGFLGGNGVGKTTLLKCILGLCFPDSGSYSFFGKPMGDKSIYANVGFLPERPYFYKNLKAIEFLEFYGALAGMEDRVKMKARIEKLLDQLNLSFAKNRPLNQFSKGMLQKIGAIQAVLHEPDFIILDEPMSGLDPDGRFMIRDLILEEKQRGATIFFSSHLFHDVENLCTDLVILKAGNLVYKGSLADFTSEAGCGYEIIYLEAGQVAQTLTSETLEACQKDIANLQQKSYQILSVSSKKLSLEQMFRRKALSNE